MKRAVTLLSFILLIGFIFVVNSCDLLNNDGGGSSSFRISEKNLNVKSVFVGEFDFNEDNSRSARAIWVNGKISSLAYLNGELNPTPFLFENSSGKTILLDVFDMYQIDEKRIWVDYIFYCEITMTGDTYRIDKIIDDRRNKDDPGYGSGLGTLKASHLIINMESNEIYDMREYNTPGVGAIADNYIYLACEDLGPSPVIYKINLDDMSAFKINSIPSGDVIAEPYCIGNKLMVSFGYSGGSYLSVDVNNKFPPQPIDLSYFKERYGNLFAMNYCMLFPDLSGDVYFFSLVDGKIGKVLLDDYGVMSLEKEETTVNLETINRMSPINKDWAIALNSRGNGRFFGSARWPNNYVLMAPDGFVTFTKKQPGIKVELTSLPIEAMYDVYSSYYSMLIVDNYLYYQKGTSIKKLHLAAGSVPETLYSDNRLLTTANDLSGHINAYSYLYSSGNTLFFYQYANNIKSKDEVCTYSLQLDQPGAEPKQVADYPIVFSSFVELGL